MSIDTDTAVMSRAAIEEHLNAAPDPVDVWDDRVYHPITIRPEESTEQPLDDPETEEIKVQQMTQLPIPVATIIFRLLVLMALVAGVLVLAKYTWTDFVDPTFNELARLMRTNLNI